MGRNHRKINATRPPVTPVVSVVGPGIGPAGRRFDLFRQHVAWLMDRYGVRLSDWAIEHDQLTRRTQLAWYTPPGPDRARHFVLCPSWLEPSDGETQEFLVLLEIRLKLMKGAA